MICPNRLFIKINIYLLKAHVSVLQQIATDLDLSFKPSKCISYLFDGHSHRKEGIPLSGGYTRLITEDSNKFLGKSWMYP